MASRSGACFGFSERAPSRGDAIARTVWAMTGWHLAHFCALAVWGGLVLAEVVVELALRDQPAAVAKAHYYIDLCCELPTLLAVLITGTVLTLAAPWSALLAIKVGCGLFAVGVNVWCAWAVWRRHRDISRGSAEDTERATQKVFLSVKLGLPAGLVALYLGLRLRLG